MRTTDKRVLIFDIESTNLTANFGYCLCFGYKFLGDKGRAKVLAVTDYKHHKQDPTNDAALMRDVHELMTNQADIIVSFYGKEFDRKFLNTRMLLAGLPPLPPLNHEHVDLYFTARGNLRLHSNRLAVVSETLGCPKKKTALSGPTWVRAMAGDRKAIEYIKEHCIMDVEVLEWCYLKLRPYIRQHPRVGSQTACPTCGDSAIQFRGWAVTTSKGRERRTQCMGCGRWGRAKEEATC